VDRREALKKLGAAGVIVVGGSAVLSSQDVAFAASAVCVASIPDAIGLTITQLKNKSRVRISYAAPSTPGVTPKYQWSSPTLGGFPAPAGGVRILAGAGNRTMTLQRTTTPTGTTSRNWAVGEQFSVLFTITWSCRRPRRNDVAGYLVTSTYLGGKLPVTSSVSVVRYS
jgi:hypothetical protein